MHSGSLLFFYTVPASMLFIYGIGLEQLIINSRSKQSCFVHTGKTMLMMFCAASVIRLIQVYVHLPLKLNFFLPIVAGGMLVLSELLIQWLFTKKIVIQPQERVFSYGTVLFAFYFAFSYLELVIIIVSAGTGLLIWTAILRSTLLRIDEIKCPAQWKKMPFLFIIIGFISLALYMGQL